MAKCKTAMTPLLRERSHCSLRAKPSRYVQFLLVSCLTSCVGECYFSEAPGPNQDSMRCATERVEAVTSLDILYNRFHKITMKTMQASDLVKSCGSIYTCPDGEPGCVTR